MYIEAQYNAAIPNGEDFQKEFEAKLKAEFPEAEIQVYADGAPSIIIFDVDDEAEKEKVKFRIIELRNETKMGRKAWRTW